MNRTRFLVVAVGLFLCAAGVTFRHNALAQNAGDGSGGFAHHNENEAAIEAKTPEDAARFFLDSLVDARLIDNIEATFTTDNRKQLKGRSLPLVRAMRDIVRGDGWKLRTQTTGDGQKAVVEATPIQVPMRAVVCVREDEVWRVDAIETYRRWMNFAPGEEGPKIFELTGARLPGMRPNARNDLAVCQSQMKSLALGAVMYMQDWDEKLPSARTWHAAVAPYTKSLAIFTCPSVAKNGYAINARLSMKTYGAIENTALTAILYETKQSGENAFGLGEDVSFRHLNGANYAFADGHIKWYPRGKKPSFLFKVAR